MIRILLFLAALMLASPASAQQMPRTWIVFGDSIQSWVPDGSPDQLDLYLLEARRDILVRNLSTPGAYMGRASLGFNNTWTTDVLSGTCGHLSTCDVVVIQAGSNDFLDPTVSWQNVSDSMMRLINWARARGKKVLVLDLIWRSAYENAGPNHMGMTFAQYRFGRAYACGLNADVCTFAPRPAAFDVATPSLYGAAERANGNLIHPNAAGHAVMADWIESAAAQAGLF